MLRCFHFPNFFYKFCAISVWCHGDFMVFQVGIDNFAVCAEQLGWMWSGWCDPWMWWIGVLRMEDEFFRYCRLDCEQWVISETKWNCYCFKWRVWYVGTTNGSWHSFFQTNDASKNPTESRNSHRPLELGFLTIGRCSRSHGEGVRSVGCLMALHCWWLEKRGCCAILRMSAWWCWIGALIVMTRKARSFAPVVTDLSAESPHLWWTAESSTSARIWSPFPSDKRGTRPKVSKKIPKCKKPWILAICHLKADGQKADGHGKNMNQNGVDHFVPCSCTIFQQPQHSVTFWYFPNSMNLETPFFHHWSCCGG